MSLLIIDNYDSFTYNMVQCVEQAGAEDYLLVKNDLLNSLKPAQFEKVLISPGPGIASESGQLPGFIKKFYQSKSFFGICLGFEALLEFFGAKLSLLPEPMHGIQNEGTILHNDPLFQHLPPKFQIGALSFVVCQRGGFPGGNRNPDERQCRPGYGFQA